MLKVTANRPIQLNLGSFTEFEQGYLTRGLHSFFLKSSHPHPRSQKLRTYPEFITAIKNLCTGFEQQAQPLLSHIYELGYTPGMAGSSLWDKRLYDVDDKNITIDWIQLAYQFPNPQFVLNGDIIGVI